MDYQTDYASTRPQMYDKKSREIKAKRIIKTLANYFGENKLKDLKILDIGCSTGIIDHILAEKFKYVLGTDIDKDAVKFANQKYKSKNLIFKVEDAMQFKMAANSFDIIICTHVYEHVPSPKKLFSEIYRLLKPDGVCYLAAINQLWPMEPHYNLLFLSYLPKSFANIYVRLFKKAKKYYETPLNYWALVNLTSKFKRLEYTQKILRNPSQFGYQNTIQPNSIQSYAAFLLSPLSKYLSPTFFWLLKK